MAPAELEALLVRTPSVADAAVIGSGRGGRRSTQGIRRLEGRGTADELMAYVAERVAPYKKMRRVEFVDEIPKSPAGKILRRVLVEQERARAVAS